MIRILSRTSPFLFLVSSLWAGPCATTTLDQYLALTPNVGCTIGPLIFENFSFIAQSTTGAPVVAAPADILVTPQTGAEFGLSLSSAKFQEAGSTGSIANSVTYVLTYTEDPTGSIRSLDSVLNDPVTAPGKGEIDSIGCLGGMWTAFNVCSTANLTSTVTVFDAGTTSQLTASANFTPVAVLGVQSSIFLTGDVANTGQNGGSVVFNSFGSQSLTPEPGTGLLTGVILAGLFMLGKARLKRAQVRLQQRP